MREETPPLRETPRAAVDAAWTASAWSWRGLGRGVVICLLFAIFLTFAGVSTAYRGGFASRFAYMAVISLIAFLTAFCLTVLLFRYPLFSRHRWVGAIAVGVIQAPVMGVLVWLGDNLLTGWSRPPALIGGYIYVSLFISLFMNLLIQLMSRYRTVVVEKVVAAPTVRFLERLPPKLRGGSVWAVEAEDHYLRLHTSKGQDLILMRLSDAIPELEGIEGAQVHRSWWIARDAIADVARGDGRATLTLRDGSEVPVSRTYAKVLRDRGWL